MRVKGDSTGVEKLMKVYEDAYYSTLAHVGREATRNARITGTYQNRTGNLRNANGGCVVRDGRIIDMWVETDGFHPEAVKNTENLLIYSEKPKDGLYLANGMFYTSFVESKNYEVILTHGLLFAERQLKKRL
jgi:hypothetical protein